MTIPRLLLLAFLTPLLFAADEKKPEPKYEMTNYVMGLLRRGPNWTAAKSEETQRIQDGHMANIQKMAATGKRRQRTRNLRGISRATMPRPRR